MELFRESCKTCAGDLEPINASQYKCVCCGNVYTHEEAQKHVDTLRSLLDDMKFQAVTNARRNLYKAVTAKYISSKEMHEWCRELKKYLPDDFQANFYEIAISNNGLMITETINGINVEENAPYLETAIQFLLRSLKKEYQIATGDLIKRAYEFTDPRKYADLISKFEKEVEKNDELVYETSISRDVFLAYSSKDREATIELLEYLEAQGLSCFFAERNLRRGEGSRENYDQALEEAMDNCSSFVFVSSPNSRNVQCDAFKKEIAHIKRRDFETAPPEYRNVEYTKIPQTYKKHRVEYRIENSKTPNRADFEVKKFFDGYQWALRKEEVVDRIFDHQMAPVDTASTPAPAIQSVKYCIGCGAECPLTVNACPKCRGREFADTENEARYARENKQLREEKAAATKTAPADQSLGKAKYCIDCGAKCPLTVNSCHQCHGREFADTENEARYARENKQLKAAQARASQASTTSRPVQQNSYGSWQGDSNYREYQTLQTARQNAVQAIDTQTREKARLQEAIADAQEKSYKAIKPKSLKRWATFSVWMVVLTFVALVIGGSMGSAVGIALILVFAAGYILTTLKFLKVYRKPRLLILLNLVTYGLFTIILAAIAIHKCKKNNFPIYENEIRDLNNQLGNVEYRLNTARNSLDEVERKLANLNYR